MAALSTFPPPPPPAFYVCNVYSSSPSSAFAFAFVPLLLLLRLPSTCTTLYSLLTLSLCFSLFGAFCLSLSICSENRTRWDSLSLFSFLFAQLALSLRLVQFSFHSLFLSLTQHLDWIPAAKVSQIQTRSSKHRHWIHSTWIVCRSRLVFRFWIIVRIASHPCVIEF